MSGIAAIFGANEAFATEARILRMLAVMRQRGGDRTDVSRALDACLGVARYEWELESGFSGPVGVVEQNGCAIIADASLYHRDDLRRAIQDRGVETGPTASHLMLGAYRALGVRALPLFEGDFAFVLFDRAARRIVAARDFVGSRPLFFTVAGRTLIVASTIDAVRSHPACPDDLNLQALADTCSMFLAPAHETALQAVHSVPAGHMLHFDLASGDLKVERFWSAPRFADDVEPPIPFEEAAGELRKLMQAAVAERLPSGGSVSISLSGGWDSPILYGLAHSVGRDRGASPGLIRPVSLSFPPGDSGREDEIIERITSHFRQSTRWLNIRDLPLLYDGMLREAATRDDPFVHPFLPTNRALAAAAAEGGAHVALNGYGGDNLFHAEIAYLGDLLVRGRVREFLREWKSEGLHGARTLYRHALLPRLGPTSRRLVGLVTRRRVAQGYLQRPVAPWLRKPFSDQAEQRERRYSPVREQGEPLESFEHRWMLEHPLYARMLAWIGSISLAEGVEERMPLIDGRLVRFAAGRPRRERRSNRTTKRLFRAAAADLLPADVLAPRAERTGTMADYWASSMARDLLPFTAKLFEDPILAQLGIVDPDTLRRAAATLRSDRTRAFDAALYTTFQTEAWLRGRSLQPG